MEYENTVDRLMNLLAQRREQAAIYSTRRAYDNLIEAQVERVKVNVFIHLLTAMALFTSEPVTFIDEVEDDQIADPYSDEPYEREVGA